MPYFKSAFHDTGAYKKSNGGMGAEGTGILAFQTGMKHI